MRLDIHTSLIKLENETDTNIRNALALKLAETQNPKVLETLLRLIKKPELENKRGTLVHCLQYYDCNLFFETLIELIVTGNWEVTHEAAGIIAQARNIEYNHVQRMTICFLECVQNENTEEWRTELMESLS